MVKVLIEHGEAPWKTGPQAAAQAGTALTALTHHQNGVVLYALGALRHRVHPDHEDDVDDALECKREACSNTNILKYLLCDL